MAPCPSVAPLWYASGGSCSNTCPAETRAAAAPAALDAELVRCLGPACSSRQPRSATISPPTRPECTLPSAHPMQGGRPVKARLSLSGCVPEAGHAIHVSRGLVRAVRAARAGSAMARGLLGCVSMHVRLKLPASPVTQHSLTSSPLRVGSGNADDLRVATLPAGALELSRAGRRAYLSCAVPVAVDGVAVPAGQRRLFLPGEVIALPGGGSLELSKEEELGTAALVRRLLDTSGLLTLSALR